MLISAARRLTGVGVLTLLLAGVPYGLLHYLHHPWPTHILSWHQLGVALSSPMTDEMLGAILTALLWLAWASFTWSVIAEFTTALAGVRLPQPRALAPARGIAAILVAMITGGVLATAAQAATGSLHHPAMASPPTTSTTQTAPSGHALHAVARLAGTTTPAGPVARPAPVTADSRAMQIGQVTLVAAGREYTYTVRHGDSLSEIAEAWLGDVHRWPEIFALNRGTHFTDVGGTLTNPNLIYPGWKLDLPDDATPPPDVHPDVLASTTTPTPTPPAPHSLPQTGPHRQPSTPSTSPTASNHDDDRGGVNTPPPSRTAPSSAPTPAGGSASSSVSASPDTSADHGAEAPPSSPRDGVDLPGGWITVGLGGGLLAAVAMVWRRRRHRYQPTAITSPHLNDPDLLPPLAAMTRLRTSLRRAAPETLDEQPATTPTVREYRAAVVKPDLPPVGPGGSDLAGAAALPLATGLGLTGDGALDAARGLLVATLAAGSNDDPDAKGRAIIPAATLATLLGVSAVDLGHLDRLRVTDSDADAITQLEEEIIRRSRLIADAQVADVHTWRDTDVHAEPLPQLLLIAEVPEKAWTHRLVTAVRLGHSVDIGAALIGDWPTGTTLTVAADGTTGNHDTPRLTILDTTAAIEMLGMLREAHGDTDSPAHPQPSELPHPPAPAPAAPDVVVAPDTGHGDDTAASATAASTSRLPVAVRVLGRPAVLDHDGQPSPGIRSKAIELLVYLAVNRQGADLSDIMEALFPDATMRRAGERLSTVAADLRKHIRQAAGVPVDTEQSRKQRLEPIPNTGSRYHLDPAIVRVDWWTVLDHYEATATATTDEQRLTHLTTAIAAAGGALAEGVEYDWIDTDREVVRRHRIKLHAHAAALFADTDAHQSWLLLEQACQIDPLSDELARTTMHAAATLGDADAIRHRLKTLRDALDAHGLELSDETASLARELLRQLRPPPLR